MKVLKDTRFYSGLQPGTFTSSELIDAVEASVNAGTNGVSLLIADSIFEEQWKALSAYMKNK